MPPPLVRKIRQTPTQARPNSFLTDAENTLDDIAKMSDDVNAATTFVDASVISVSNSASSAANAAATATAQATISTQQAAAVQASLAAFPGAASTSGSVLNWVTGVQYLGTQVNKSFVVGQQIIIAAAGQPTSFLICTCTAYTAASGAMSVSVASIKGAAPAANNNWVLSVTGPAGDSTLKNIVVLTASTNWVAPANCTLAEVEVVGGGSSSGIRTDYRPGGGGGGYTKKIGAIVPGATYTVTVGAAGTRVVTANQIIGNAGGTSSFVGPGFALSATGGTCNASGEGIAGVGSGGDLNVAGGYSTPVPYSLGGGTPLGTGPKHGMDAANFGCGAGGTYREAQGYVGKAGVVIIRFN